LLEYFYGGRKPQRAHGIHPAGLLRDDLPQWFVDSPPSPLSVLRRAAEEMELWSSLV
jgi:hypothetical protein